MLSKVGSSMSLEENKTLLITLNGSHGTAKYHAESINKNGFDVSYSNSTRNKAGAGCYFWAFDSNPIVANELAKKWWEYAKKEGLYDKDKDHSFSCFNATLQSKKEKIFDGTSLDFKEKVNILKMNPKFKGKKDGFLIDLLLSEYEKRYGIKYQLNNFSFNILKLDLSVPKIDNKQLALANSYIAYIVKNNSSIINFKEVHYKV